MQRPDVAMADERTSYALLSSLRADGPQRLSTLAEVVRLDRSTVSRQLAALEQRGLVGAGRTTPTAARTCWR